MWVNGSKLFGQPRTQTALLDRAGRIKPCGGAIPPRAIIDFEIPDELLKVKGNHS